MDLRLAPKYFGRDSPRPPHTLYCTASSIMWLWMEGGIYSHMNSMNTNGCVLQNAIRADNGSII